MDSGLEKLKDAIETAIADLSDEQLLSHPEGKWCTAEILEHLYLTYTGTTKGFERVLADGSPKASTLSMRHRMRQIVVVGFGYLPEGRKSPTVAVPTGLPLDKVKGGIAKSIVAMDSVIAQCGARFGSRVPVLDHPVLGPLTARQWRKFHVVHGRHHVKQLLRLRE